MKFWQSFIILFLPSRLKVKALKRMGFAIGTHCRIGFSLIQANTLEFGDNVYIGHLNVLWRLNDLRLGSGSRITFKNWISGSRRGSFVLGKNSSISGRHFFDASAGISIGENTIIAGRESQFFTHGITPDCLDSRKPINIGDWCYIGSKSGFVPGSGVSHHVFVGMGSVVTKYHESNYVLIAGSPAVIKKNLDENALFFNRAFMPHAHHVPSYDGNRS